MSLRATVSKAHKKMMEGCRSVECEPSMDKEGKHDGGYIVTKHMHDYEHQLNGAKSHVKNHHELARHIKETFGGPPAESSKGSTVEEGEELEK
jgi:hypothetical protein